MRIPGERERIRLGHGGGGTLMRQLIDGEFRRLYADPDQLLHDAAVLPIDRETARGPLAFTADATVVQPLIFPGGDIGRLAVIGTANDLAMAGARPLHLSLTAILEEGLELEVLRGVVNSMVQACLDCGVTIEAGDTKVVERGKGDGIFLSTSGIGAVESPEPVHPGRIAAGDAIVVSGDLGRHGLAILALRHRLRLEPAIASDCAPLWPLVEQLLKHRISLHCLRDLTRGGLAMALQELADAGPWCLRLEETLIPIARAVRCSCEILGLDPLHLANEGRFVAIVPAEAMEETLAVLEPTGGRWIGTVVGRSGSNSGEVRLRTALETERRLQPPSGELLPRIC